LRLNLLWNKMIPAIFALLSITLGDGHYKNGFFEHNDPIKIIQHHVVEESWEKEAIQLTKSHIKEMHRLKHQGGKLFHELTKASKSRTDNEGLIDSLIHQILIVENQQNKNWIESRFDLSRKMAAEEFYKVMESTKTLDKIRAENQETKETSRAQRTLYFEALKQSVNSQFERLDNENIMRELETFQSIALTAFDSLDNIKYNRDPRLDNHHATRKELTNFSDDILSYDKKVLEAYLMFHRQLTTLSTDKQWHSVEKSMSKALKD